MVGVQQPPVDHLPAEPIILNVVISLSGVVYHISGVLAPPGSRAALPGLPIGILGEVRIHRADPFKIRVIAVTGAER